MDCALQDLERSGGEFLPRPVVLEGDLSHGGLGLSQEARTWVRRHTTAILHNAASLTFDSKGPEDEPWITNVRGTQHILQFAREQKIREFHHVSTAYVCGLRTGVCREDELDVGQELGNDYERSKLEAEQLVRNADWIDAPTIYRPAIIVGDSQTAFTNTFHGFYTPSKIVDAILPKLALNDVEPRLLVEALGLKGDEQKNLVPVDWVSAVLVSLLAQPRNRGMVFHLTPSKTVSVADLLEVMDLAIQRYSNQPSRSNRARDGQAWHTFLPVFREKMETYRAYWRDDPSFDKSNTLARAGQIESPEVDKSLLLRLCRFAIEHKFWWSRGHQSSSGLDIAAFVQQLPKIDRDDLHNPLAMVVDLRVTGPGGGDWVLLWKEGTLSWIDQGSHPQRGILLTMRNDTFAAIASGCLTPAAAIDTGTVAVEGPLWAADEDVCGLLSAVSELGTLPARINVSE
jgi:nucleoside-diphosphate-sugar epimerase